MVRMSSIFVMMIIVSVFLFLFLWRGFLIVMTEKKITHTFSRWFQIKWSISFNFFPQHYWPWALKKENQNEPFAVIFNSSFAFLVQYSAIFIRLRTFPKIISQRILTTRRQFSGTYNYEWYSVIKKEKKIIRKIFYKELKVITLNLDFLWRNEFLSFSVLEIMQRGSRIHQSDGGNSKEYKM